MSRATRCPPQRLLAWAIVLLSAAGLVTSSGADRLAPTQVADADGNWAGSSAGSPPERGRHSAVWDVEWNRMIVFGGMTSTSPWSNETWQLTLGASPTWNQIGFPLGTLPSARYGMSAILDPLRHRMIMFGGSDFYALRNGISALSLSESPTWTHPAPGGPLPAPRQGHAAVYDPVRDRMIIFGGYLGSGGPENDVWALSLSEPMTWELIYPTGPRPSRRSGAAMIYDPARDRLVLFGGAASSTGYTDVWQLSLSGIPAWTQLTPSGIPPLERSDSPAIYDPVRDRIVFFGGWRPWGSDDQLDDVQSLDLAGGTSWQQLAPSGSGPFGRHSHSIVYDRAADRMVLYGGLSTPPNIYNGDTHFLNWGSPASGIDVVPMTLEYGAVNLDMATPRAVTVTNYGSSSLTVSNIASPDPSVTANPTAFTLAPRESRIVHVQWTPTSPGALGTTVVVTSDDPTNPTRTISVNGTAVVAVPGLVVPHALDFGSAFVDLTVTQTMVVSYVGLGSVTVSNIASADPTLTAGPTAFTLAHGESRNVSVHWTPASPGAHTATLVVTSDDPDAPTQMIEVNGTAENAPASAVTPDSVHVTLERNQTATHTLRIDNTGAGNLYFFATEVASAPNSPAAATVASERAGPTRPGLFRAGGPDRFGYTYRDSDEPGGPSFSWIDVRSLGTQIPADGNDQNMGPFDIGFEFPFYGQLFTSFRLCTNGWISFTSNSPTAANVALPNNGASVPNNLLAVYWDDLTFGGTPRVWYYVNNGRLVIQYAGVERVGEPGLPNSFEVVLYPDGTILYQYDTMSSTVTYSATIGIMNATRDDALQVNFNAPYIHNGQAIRFAYPPVDFMKVSPGYGTIEPGGHADLTLSFDSMAQPDGDYPATVRIQSNDPAIPTRDVPCLLTVATPVAVPGVAVERFGLRLAGPNPTSAGVRLELAVPKQAEVVVRVFDLRGGLVRELARREFAPGMHPLEWDGTGAGGRRAKAGVYFVQASGAEGRLERRVVLMR